MSIYIVIPDTEPIEGRWTLISELVTYLGISSFIGLKTLATYNCGLEQRVTQL